MAAPRPLGPHSPGGGSGSAACAARSENSYSDFSPALLGQAWRNRRGRRCLQVLLDFIQSSPEKPEKPPAGKHCHHQPSCWAGHGSLRGAWRSFRILDFKPSVEICSFWDTRQARGDLHMAEPGRSFTRRDTYLDFQWLSCEFQKARCWYSASGCWKKRSKISLLTVVAVWTKYHRSTRVRWVVPRSPTREQIFFFPVCTFTEKIMPPVTIKFNTTGSLSKTNCTNS